MGAIYSESVPTAPEALSIAGDAATGLKAIVSPTPTLTSALGEVKFLANFGTESWPHCPGSRVLLTTKSTSPPSSEADQRRPLTPTASATVCIVTRSGAIRRQLQLRQNGETVQLVIEVLPTAERTGGESGLPRAGTRSYSVVLSTRWTAQRSGARKRSYVPFHGPT